MKILSFFKQRIKLKLEDFEFSYLHFDKFCKFDTSNILIIYQVLTYLLAHFSIGNGTIVASLYVHPTVRPT